ncbi:MAG: lipid A deacylase LpxR family protein [Desulfuromonadales bacterium]|nr:lipid A deacylase LpxR family protein [Desulfuromonadales bacterium]
MSFVYENDVFNNSDVHYTNGIRVSWIPASSQTPDWAIKVARAVPWFPRHGEVLHGYSIGQSMFTSNDISQEVPSPDSHPYAGWLYCSISLSVEAGRQLDQLVLTGGVVGPAALGEQTQKVIHQLVGSQLPQGWDHQLHNEPGLMLSWQRSWRALATRPVAGRQLDLTPHVGMTLGNVLTYGNGGLTLRYGSNLPVDYGPPRIQPGLPGTSHLVPAVNVGWYLFAGVEGRVVVRNIFLDGNSFRNSRSVDKEPLVSDLQFGGVILWNRIRLSYTHVLRSREFKTQETRDNFGSINISVQF